MSGIHNKLDALLAAGKPLDPDAPVAMLNLIRFHATPQYSDRTPIEVGSDAEISGAESYMTRYIPAWEAMTKKYRGAEVRFLSREAISLVGPEQEAADHWHAVGLMQYKSFQAFRDTVRDPEYLRLAEPHRLAAVQDWRLIMCA